MSYYDFDNHFWSSQEVCCQSASPKSDKKVAKTWERRRKIQIGLLFIACVAIWTPLLLTQAIFATQKNQDNNVENTADSSSFCVTFRSEPQRMHCSAP
jgi:hypothetical protein